MLPSIYFINSTCGKWTFYINFESPWFTVWHRPRPYTTSRPSSDLETKRMVLNSIPEAIWNQFYISVIIYATENQKEPFTVGDTRADVCV